MSLHISVSLTILCITLYSVSMNTNDALTASHIQELRRGTVVLAVLSQLQEPGYGYALLESLQAAGIDVDANTLYPLLRRLEKQELLTSDWDTGGGRPRKYYRTSQLGAEILAQLAAEWTRINASVLAVLEMSDR